MGTSVTSGRRFRVNLAADPAASADEVFYLAAGAACYPAPIRLTLIHAARHVDGGCMDGV